MLNRICGLLLFLGLLMVGTCVSAQLPIESYKNPQLPVEQRVAAIPIPVGKTVAPIAI